MKAEAGIDFPQDPQEQLRYAIEAVFKSWNGERARVYRKMEKIADDLGTAVNVQTMVFGNKGDDSGTGVAFTRDPATGENRPYGDFLRNAQGEDVVAGIRVTEPLDAMADSFPECHQQLLDVMQTLAVALPRHVRHRVHDRARPALHPADPRRQAHRGRRAADGRGDARGGDDRQARGGAARAAGSSSTSCCIPSSIRRRRTPRSPRASTPRPAPPSARSRSPPTTPSSERERRRARSSSCGPRRPPTTSTG